MPGVFITAELGTNKVISQILFSPKCQKNEVGAENTIGLNFMDEGIPVLFVFFLLLIASDCVNLEALRRLFLIVSIGKPLCV